MKGAWAVQGSGLRRAAAGILTPPQSLAFMPALTLAAFWLGGEAMLVVVALGMPLVIAMTAEATPPVPRRPAARTDRLLDLDEAAHLADAMFEDARDASLSTGCMLLDVEGLERLERQAGSAAAECARELGMTRMRATLRHDDVVVRIGDARFMVMLAPSVRMDVETMLQLGARLQSAVEEPASIESAVRHFTVCLGFCGSPAMPAAGRGQDLLEGAQLALGEARHAGPSTIRGYSTAMRDAFRARRSLVAEVRQALADGQVQPWFQPQICTSTGRISGVEALARWIHPERGIVPPAQFLRCLEEAGQMTILGDVILKHSLTALRSWDAAGLDVPRVSVNFSGAELRSANLAERIGWELDRFGLTPQRLGIEVLETVITAQTDDGVARNIRDLAALGCHIDLDDFGTGHASLTSLTKLRIDRLKIDHSYVSRVDRDENQRRMLAAVLSLADRLGIETLAEGVETVGEHALLAQLGCDHVQGYGIARPMPADQLVVWASDHAKRIAEAQRLGRTTG